VLSTKAGKLLLRVTEAIGERSPREGKRPRERRKKPARGKTETQRGSITIILAKRETTRYSETGGWSEQKVSKKKRRRKETQGKELNSGPRKLMCVGVMWVVGGGGGGGVLWF